MAALLIIAHAPLASALKAVAAHAFPERQDEVAAVDVGPEVGDAEEEARSVLARLGEQDVLVLTDAFGASPSNLALRLAEQHPRLRVVAGVNVPMVWRALGYAGCPLDDWAGCAIAGGNQGVVPVKTTPRQNQPQPPMAGDEVPHPDQ